MHAHLIVVGVTIVATCTEAFTAPSTFLSNRSSIAQSTPCTKVHLSESDLSGAILDARRLFFLWFGGTSGGGGIAVAAFPKMFERYMDVLSLKGIGPTLGGDKFGISPLCGYPEDICISDLDKILNNKKSVEQMVKSGPKDSFWSEKGYLRYEAFEAANPNCNPLALRVVFDALTTSTSTVSPIVAQELLEAFKADRKEFKKTLLLSKLKGYSAIGFLLFLLGIALGTSGQALAQGWFPEWPGIDNFPLGLVNPGVWTIPQYWI